MLDETNEGVIWGFKKQLVGRCLKSKAVVQTQSRTADYSNRVDPDLKEAVVGGEQAVATNASEEGDCGEAETVFVEDWDEGDR